MSQVGGMTRRRGSWVLLGMCLALLLTSGCNGATTGQDYQPLGWDGERIVERPALLSPAHLDRLEQVLRYYRIPYRRAGPSRLLLEAGVDRDTLRNFTRKAEDEQWLAGHPLGR